MTVNRTQDRFGYQWTHFDQLTPEFEAHFRTFLGPMDPTALAGKLVLDAGCGYGRYALYAEQYGARVVGMDFSEAITAAKEKVDGRRISLVMGDILHPPFRSQSFDVVMSLGVLHHLPEPLEGFLKLRRCVREGGSIALWMYSTQRKLSIAVVETLRALARPIPNAGLRWVSLALALPDFAASKVAGAIRPLLGIDRWNRTIPTHFRLYAGFPFRVCWADWFDRLGAPIRHYHTRSELLRWLELAGIEGTVSPTEDYGWSVVARVPDTDLAPASARR